MSEHEIIQTLCRLYGSQSGAARALGVHRGYFSRLHSERHLSVPLLRRIRERVPELKDAAESALLAPAHSLDEKEGQLAG